LQDLVDDQEKYRRQENEQKPAFYSPPRRSPAAKSAVDSGPLIFEDFR